MTTAIYIFIILGLLLTFLLWRTWKNTDKLIDEFGIPKEEVEDCMKALHWKIWACYGVAFFLKLLA